MSGAIGAFEAVTMRLGKLTKLLGALAAATGQRKLQEGALFVAADYADDTHRQLAELVDTMRDSLPAGSAA